MPSGFLQAIVRHPGIYQTLSEPQAEEVAVNYGTTAEEVQRLTGLVVLLKERLVQLDRRPAELLEEISAVLDHEMPEDRERVLLDALTPSAIEREDVLTMLAFADGPVLQRMQLRPCMLPARHSGAEVVGGYFYTVTYLDAEGVQNSITVGVPPSAIEGFKQLIDGAQQQLEAIKASIGKTSRVCVLSSV